MRVLFLVVLGLLGVVVLFLSYYYVCDILGCGKFYDDCDGIFLWFVEFGGIEWNYSIYLLFNYLFDEIYLVVFGFYGLSSIGLFFEVDINFSNIVDVINDGVIMVYLDGIGGVWVGVNYFEVIVF